MTTNKRELEELTISVEINKEDDSVRLIEKDAEGNIIHKSKKLSLSTAYSIGQTMRVVIAKYSNMNIKKCSHCNQYYIKGLND